MSANPQDTVIISLPKVNTTLAIVFAIVGIIIWPAVWYAKVNAAIENMNRYTAGTEQRLIKIEENSTRTSVQLAIITSDVGWIKLQIPQGPRTSQVQTRPPGK